jgi:hypothetical protein
MPNFHAEVSEVFAEIKRAEDAARERQHALFHAFRRAGVPGLVSAPDDGDDGETGLRAALAGAAHEDLVHIILALTVDKRYQRYTISQEAVLTRAREGAPAKVRAPWPDRAAHIPERSQNDTAELASKKGLRKRGRSMSPEVCHIFRVFDSTALNRSFASLPRTP